MKRIFIAGWLLLFTTSLFSQSKADSLKKLLQLETVPANQIEWLIKISDEYRVSNTDSSFSMLQKQKKSWQANMILYNLPERPSILPTIITSMAVQIRHSE